MSSLLRPASPRPRRVRCGKHDLAQCALQALLRHQSSTSPSRLPAALTARFRQSRARTEHLVARKHVSGPRVRRALPRRAFPRQFGDSRLCPHGTVEFSSKFKVVGAPFWASRIVRVSCRDYATHIPEEPSFEHDSAPLPPSPRPSLYSPRPPASTASVCAASRRLCQSANLSKLVRPRATGAHRRRRVSALSARGAIQYIWGTM